MNSSLQFCLTVMGQVTAISFAAVLLMAVARFGAATRHAVGLLGLALVLGSPLLAWMLPQTVWKRSKPQLELAADPSLSQPESVASRQSQPVSTNPESEMPTAEQAESSRIAATSMATPASSSQTDWNSAGNQRKVSRSGGMNALSWLLYLAGSGRRFRSAIEVTIPMSNFTSTPEANP